MKPSGREAVGLVAFFVLALGPACGAGTSSATLSPSPSAAGSATPSGNGAIDPAVAMPNGFPSDFPIYPGSRLTHASQATANGQTSWGMEWETRDTAEAVQTFYMSKLNQGDWTIPYSSTGNRAYSAVFTLNNNSQNAALL